VPKDNIFKSIFIKYDTDKVTAGYEYAYEEVLSPIRNKIKLLIEIGVNRGGSVRAFKEYLPNSLIVGLEINKSSFFEDDRIKIEIGNATNKDFIDMILDKYGNPDVVIDDGSHFSRDIKTSFTLLYPHTKICYVIEDLGTQSYNFEKGFYINDHIPATIIAHQEIDKLLLYEDTSRRSIKIYRSICFFFNSENIPENS
jgi:hypothetical protein